MNGDPNFSDPERVFCEICAKEVKPSAALWVELSDGVAYFCGPDCYDSWSRGRTLEDEPHALQVGQKRQKSLDERMKRFVMRHPEYSEVPLR